MTKQIDLAKYTSIGIGPIVDVEIIDTIAPYEDFFILGRGNNLLVSNNPPKFAILGEIYDYIKIIDNLLVVGAATSSGKLLTFCRKNNIAGFELLAKLPGNLGGIVKMNAGLKEWEIFNHLHSISTSFGTFSKEQIEHGYRHTKIKGVIYEAKFFIKEGFAKDMLDFFIQLRDNQPHEKSAGSCFKNPKGDAAGRLIEAVGLKGKRIGDMAFSSVHANFLVNLGKGNFEDAKTLITLAQKEIKNQFLIDLEPEIIIL